MPAVDRLNLSLPAEIGAKLRRLAEERNMTVTQLLCEVVESWDEDDTEEEEV